MSSKTCYWNEYREVYKWKYWPSKDLLRSVEGHREASHKEISKGETDKEVIVDASKSSVEEDARDNEQVREDRHQDDQDEH